MQARPPPKTEVFGQLFAGVTGLEPAIFGLTGRRDNQLRYTPVMEKNIA